jgi:tol-pal system protein YbgF
MRMLAAGGWIATLAAAVVLPLSVFAAALPPIVESRPIDAQGTTAQGGFATVSPGSLEDRVARLERQADNPIMLEMHGRLEALQLEVQQLRGEVEVQTHKLGSIELRQRDLYLDIDRRIRQLESGAAAAQREDQAAMPAQVPAASPPAVATIGAVGVTAVTQDRQAEPDTERLAYQRAFDDLQAGRYEASVAAFRNFLARYPDGQYSANAQYWLGEAKYVNRQFADAIAEFDKVLQHYPGSGKAADALLKLGFSHYELQDWDKASDALNRVVTQYPGSTARQLAENRLHRMRVEGR